MPAPSSTVLTLPKSQTPLHHKALPQTCSFEAGLINLSGVLLILHAQKRGQHEPYIKQKQLKPTALPGVPPTCTMTSCTWKSPWWWTTPSWLWSRERREYSVCSSILPCRSSCVSIPLSPLSSKVRIFRKREKTFTTPRKKQMPPELSHFRHSHVYLTVGGNYFYSYTCHKPVRTKSCAERTAWAWLPQESSSGFCKFFCFLQIPQVTFPAGAATISGTTEETWRLQDSPMRTAATAASSQSQSPHQTDGAGRAAGLRGSSSSHFPQFSLHQTLLRELRHEGKS